MEATPLIKGDLIVAKDSSLGTYNLHFIDKSTGAISLNGNENLLVVQQNSSNDLNYQAAYNCIEVFSGNTSNGESAKNQYLRNTLVLSDPAKKAVSFLHINYLMGRIETQTLSQRMGELEINRDYQDDVWVKAYAGRLDNFKPSFGIDNVDYYGFQTGIDRKYGGGYYLELVAGYARGDVDCDGGEGKTDSYHLGIYGVHKDPNGFYVDGTIKYMLMKNRYDTLTANNYTVEGNGYSNGFGLSLEIGKRYKLADSRFYLEPQAQLSYAHQNSVDFYSSNGLKTRLYNCWPEQALYLDIRRILTQIYTLK